MSTIGIRVQDCHDYVVEGCKVNGADVGVDVVGGDGVLKDSSFLNVKTAVRVSAGAVLEASNIAHQEPRWSGETTPLDIVRRFANAYV